MKVLSLIGIICAVHSTPDIKHQEKLHVIDANPIEDFEPHFNAETDVRFMLFTRNNPNFGQRLTTVNSIRQSYFNPTDPVRVLIHGWNSGLESGVNVESTASYLRLGNFNVIQVDWSAGATSNNLITTRQRVGAVADVLANFLNLLVDSGLISNMERVSIAGHSLGAHIAGLTGKRVQRIGRRIHTIWGLDPAGPTFNLNSADQRLDMDDAIYTEGIRTDSNVSGISNPFCHAEFYVNGGNRQPGCGQDLNGSCSHARAYKVFAESIISRDFVAVRCADFESARNESCNGNREVSMGGEPGNVGLRGLFHLRTNEESPFAMG